MGYDENGGFFLLILIAVLSLSACRRQGGEAGDRLVIQVPEQARVSEAVVIKVTSERG